MLSALEQPLAEALAAVLPAGTAVLAGPEPLAGGPGDLRVRIVADGLAVPGRGDGESDPDGRGPAFRSRRLTLEPVEGQTDYPLPDGVGDDVISVEMPPGCLLSRGDDYAVDQGEVLFLRVPSAPVVVRTRGGPADGFAETLAAEVTLSLTAWSPSIAAADQALATALSAVLDRLHTLDVVDLAERPDQGTQFRFLRPLARLTGLSRSADGTGDPPSYAATASLRVCGRLEILLARGPAVPDRPIERLRYHVRHRPGEDGQSDRLGGAGQPN